MFAKKALGVYLEYMNIFIQKLLVVLGKITKVGKKHQSLEGHNSWSKTSKSNLTMDLKGMDYVLSTNEILNLHM